MLTAGSRLGPYEIVARLGAGGMGEVYRANDTRLGREVAVKVLSPHLASSSLMRARFEREARTVSSLNHPHICTLYDVGREGETAYLVMELIEGETLASRLTRGELPFQDCLRYGVQIADALDRAHRAGVVHRDLKPGNVMLTKAGAKLMDFGLARAASLGTASARTSASTLTDPLTAEGTIVGTLQYMAPEQLEGREADARADLWALGCVLYEMATGTRAFDGKSQASLITAIVSSEPAPISRLTPLAPPAFGNVVGACLAKDPDVRIQSAHDLKLQLEWLRGAGPQAVAAAPTAPRREWGTKTAWLLSAAALTVATIVLFLIFSKPREAESLRASITPPIGTTLGPFWSGIGLSPDGRTVAFVATDAAGRSLWVRPLDSEVARPLPDTRDATCPFWSQDSRSIAYFSADGKLKKIAIDGGSSVPIASVGPGRGGSWNRDGVIVFAPAQEGPLFRISSGGGEAMPVTALDPSRRETSHRYPSFLPDGDHFLFVTLPRGPVGWDVFVGSLKSKSVKKVLTAGSAAVYAAPGYLVFAREGSVMAQRFDPDRLELTGHAVALGLAPAYSYQDAEPVASASANGRLAVLKSDPGRAKVAWLDLTGVAGAALALPPGPWRMLRLSPDGRRAGVANGTDIWIVDLERSMPIRLADTGSTEGTLAWSPDGRRVAFVSQQTGRSEIFVGSADGSDAPELTPTNDAAFKYIMDWSPDGRFIVFQDIEPSSGADLWLVPMDGDRKAQPYLKTKYRESYARVSPDGRWLAYDSDESGTLEVYVQSFPKPGHKVRISGAGGRLPVWTREGRELRYLSGQTMMSVPIEASDEIQPGAAKAVFSRGDDVTGADFTAAGDRYLISATVEAPRREIKLFVNWTGAMPR